MSRVLLTLRTESPSIFLDKDRSDSASRVCFAPSQNKVKWAANLIVDFAKISLISGKRINTVPVYGVSRNKTLLVDSGQDSVVLAQAFESSRFPLEQGEGFSDLSCLTCARRAVRLASSLSNLTSPCNERTWNAKGTDPKTSTKRSAALRSPTGITPLGVYLVFIAMKGTVGLHDVYFTPKCCLFP